jgi:glycerol-3-phosphate dehydrogenase
MSTDYSAADGRTRADVVVIGAGVAGAALAYEFACYGVKTLVLERAHGPAAGMSGANAGILYSGFDAPAQTFETSMILAGATRWPSIFGELNIPVKVCGAVLIAQDSSHLSRLVEIERRASDHGVKVRAYDRGQIRNLEPQAKAVGGLLVPAEAITDPYEMVSRLLSTGAGLRYGSQVTAVEASGDGALVRCSSGDVEARFVINCAGLGADDISGDGSFSVDVERGDFVVFPAEATMLTDHVLQALAVNGTSAIIFPTIYGRLCAAASTRLPSKENANTAAAAIGDVQSKAARIVPKLAGFTPDDSWTGVDAVAKDRGLIAEWSKRVPKMFNVVIGRAGLVAALGLSAYVLDRCRERGLAVQSRTARRARTQDAAFPWWQRRKR